MLFSGGLDSLAGAIYLLESTNKKICLISHRSQPSIKKTQDCLIKTLKEKYPDRIVHYKFECHLISTSSLDETQRTRSFLYNSIAFCLCWAYSQNEIYVFENGITSLNFSRRADLINARASRTTHPKTLKSLQDLFSYFSETKIKIKTPFLFYTKADLYEILKKYNFLHLISSSVSCSKSYQKMDSHTHCGTCFQCIDRRLASYSSDCNNIDDAGIYQKNFITQELSMNDKTTLIDYIRQAKEFYEWDIDYFRKEKWTELLDVFDMISDMTDEKTTDNIFQLCKKHGENILKAIKTISKLYDDPYNKPLKDTFLAIVSSREYLKTPSSQIINIIDNNLKKSIPMAFQKNRPKDEKDLNDKISAILSAVFSNCEREYPTINFALAKTIPDHSYAEYNLLIETKYPRGKTSISTITDGIAADITKYPSESNILFIIYDPDRKIIDDEIFINDFKRKSNRIELFIYR